MKYAEIAPCDELKDVISHFWVCSWDPQVQDPITLNYVVANTRTNITFAFSGTSRGDHMVFSTVEGHTYIPRRIEVTGYLHQLGVSVRSHALPYLFSIASSELSQEVVSLDSLLGRDGPVLNDKIACAESTRDRIDILSTYFKMLLRRHTMDQIPMAFAADEIRKKDGEISVVDLADTYCLSQKQFKRRFQAFTGFSPKKYARVVRFESVIESYPSVTTLTELAVSKGYFDQAHFNHEFKTFTGLSPKDFWKLSDDPV